MRLAVVLCGVHPTTGEVLAISRKDDPTSFGLPGGKVDPEDGPLDPENLHGTLARAVVREIREELGVHLRPDGVHLTFAEVDPTGFLTYCFTTSPDALAGASTQEGEGIVRWVDWETLVQGPFGSYNTSIRAHLQRMATCDSSSLTLTV